MFSAEKRLAVAKVEIGFANGAHMRTGDNLRYEGPWTRMDPQPSCCKAAVLTTAPLRPLTYIPRMYF